MTRRLGIFGGSFDPIHLGHLLLAELCCEALSLDQVRFVVANVSPLKTELKKMVDNKDRIEMVRLAIGGNPAFALDTREIDRGGVSYTIDTVQAIQEENPQADLFLLMGADVLVDLHRWREPKALFRMVTPAVISRGGIGSPDWNLLAPYVDAEQLDRIRLARIDVPQIEISSTEIKNRIANGRSVRYQVPPAVETYIRETKLYRK